MNTIIKNTYRTLMSRGMKGCYVYCVDKELEAFFKSRIQMDGVKTSGPLFVSDIVSLDDEKRIKIEEAVEKQLQYKEYVPVYALEAACSLFGRGTEAPAEGWVKVSDIGPKENMFVSKVIGKSMEPLIPDGSYCVFRANVVGTRANKIVLVQHNSIFDPDTGGKYTVKKYMSKKKYSSDGTWEHEEITLLPLNSAYSPITIPNADEGEFMVIAEFITVL